MRNWYVTVTLNDGRRIEGVLAGRSAADVRAQVYAAVGRRAVFNIETEVL